MANHEKVKRKTATALTELQKKRRAHCAPFSEGVFRKEGEGGGRKEEVALPKWLQDATSTVNNFDSNLQKARPLVACPIELEDAWLSTVFEM